MTTVWDLTIPQPELSQKQNMLLSMRFRLFQAETLLAYYESSDGYEQRCIGTHYHAHVATVTAIRKNYKLIVSIWGEDITES